ncbi:MAG: phospholipase A [Deltaproteobacteria bacterium]
MMVFKAKSLIALSMLFTFSSIAITDSIKAAETEDRLTQCSRVEKDAERLKCFDELAGEKVAGQANKHLHAAATEATKESSAESNRQSVMSKQWDLDVAKGELKDTFFSIKPYRPVYFLPVAYNSSPNQEAALDFDTNAKALYNEAKFQLSFKLKPWGTDIDGIKGVKGIDVWLAYTQLAFWQVYNSAFSAPFRDTNYEPELLINLRTDYNILGLHGRLLNLGFNHQSNGRSVPLSRSWNRLVANVGLENEKNNFNLLLKTWYRIPEDEHSDDNPDITRYMGHGELWGTLYWKKQRFAVMLRNNFRQENLGAVQLDWSVPFSTVYDKFSDKCSIYLQYFNGYGESLLDYNKSINRISIGFMLADWNWH